MVANCNKEKRRAKIIEFLQWNDRNGSYTDENCDLEEIPRMTYEDAIKQPQSQVSSESPPGNVNKV
ncbi:hypothetical protein OIO11_03000 [Clostridium sp. ZS2-4]|nr:hypothetical protein [Clostridium sp. ZS2-4]